MAFPRRCQHTWTDYTPFGDVYHDCDSPAHENSRWCRFHLEQEKNEQQAKREAQEAQKRRSIVASLGEHCLRMIISHYKYVGGQCNCENCKKLLQILKDAKLKQDTIKLLEQYI